MAEQLLSNTVAYDIGANRRRVLTFMQNTHDTLRHILATTNQKQATTLRDAHDGDKGWTVLEVLCHLRDFDIIFRGRAQRILDEEYPALRGYDQAQVAAEANYNGQQLAQVIADFTASRQQTIAFFEQLAPEGWQRAGIHPERGHFTMLDSALQIGLHDTIHIEQISRILFRNEA